MQQDQDKALSQNYSQVHQSNKKESKFCLSQEDTKDFLTNSKSPFLSSPNQVQQMFQACKQNGIINWQKLNLDSLGFKLKPTRNNFCTHFIANKVEQYYQCQQCHAEGCDSMCYCESCFQPNKHEGHTYTKVGQETGWAYCDCGRYERIKQQFFCEKHSIFDQQIDCQIPQEERKKFIDYLKAVFECATYLDRNLLILHKLNQYLMKLNESSVYYNRLTYELLTTYSQFISQKYKTLFQGLHSFYFILSSRVPDKWRLTIHLCGDIKTRKNFIKYICRLVDEGHGEAIKKYFHAYALQQLLNFTAIQKLQSQDGFTHKFLHDIFGGNQSSKQIKQAYQRYVKSRLNKCKNLTQLFTLSEQIISDRNSQLILLRQLQLFPPQKQLRQITQKSFLESKKIKSNTISANIKSVTAQNIPNEVRIASKVILGLLGAMTEFNIQRLKNLRPYLLTKQVKSERLDEIIHWLILCMSYEFKYFEDKKITRMDLIIILLLIKQSPRQTQFVQQIWTQLLRSHLLYTEKQTQRGMQTVPFSEIHILADAFHYVCVILLRADFYTLIKLKSKNSQEQQEMGKWFKNFLYQRKAISLQEIVIMKSQGILDFQNASKLLNQFCQYNQDQQIFVYNSSRNFKNLANKFPLYPAKTNFPTLYNNQIYFGIEDDVEEGTLSKLLINLMFSANNIIPMLDAEWERYQKSFQFKDGKNHYGYLYLFVLIVYDTLTHGLNKQVHERLDILANTPDQLIQFAATQNELSLLVRLLGYVQKANEKKQEQKRLEAVVIDKEKAAEKKKKLAQKFNKKRQLVLQKIQSQVNASTDQQICILCHQKQKNDNQFVYISQINKNNTICSSIHGSNNISKTYLITCFHFVHVNCYIGIKKNAYFGFNCPLCQTVSNCILPISFDIEKQRLNRVCFNAMVATIMASYKVYDVQGSFVILFKHLVQSKGLNSLLELSRYQQKKKVWAKNDDYIETLMRDIYESCDEDEKRILLGEIDKFIEEIRQCQSRECRVVQLIFAETFQSIIVSGNTEINKPLLLQIRSLIQTDEFMIIKQQLQQLTLSEIQLEQQSEQQRTKLKASLSFKIIRLPQTSIELIKKYYPKNCQACAASQGLHVCLLCDNLLCNTCKLKHSTGLHNENTIYFNLTNFRIDCNRKNYSFSGHIYYNQFKVPLEVGIRFEAMVKDVYTINQIKFQKIMNNFFEN